VQPDRRHGGSIAIHGMAMCSNGCTCVLLLPAGVAWAYSVPPAVGGQLALVRSLGCLYST
jgi:hypothetical protein